MTPEDGYEYKRVITPAGTPRKIAVVGGGLVGAETAEYIAQGDCEVTIVEMMGQIAAEEWPSDTAALEEHGIKVTLVGDCNGKAADINRAVEEGYLAATAA